MHPTLLPGSSLNRVDDVRTVHLVVELLGDETNEFENASAHSFDSWDGNHGPVIGPPVAPHVATLVPVVLVETTTQAADAAPETLIAIAIAVTDGTTIPEGAGKVIAAETTSCEAATTMTAAAGKCAGGKRGTTENKGNCKNNHGPAQHDDLR